MGNKDRGSNTHGKGSGKESRGAGHKGGRGKTGGQKHEKYPQKKWGKSGFKRPQKLVEEKEIVNIGEIDQIIDYLLQREIAEEREDYIYVDVEKLEADKVLGKGKVTNKLKIEAEGFSSKAQQKIEQAGGKVEEK
ncbi:50S ribosomal protein L15 [archaeon SCG-AAA382B04]|nr:50S ribosomal protein L15 [archaeon SCG-AAA382B04]